MEEQSDDVGPELGKYRGSVNWAEADEFCDEELEARVSEIVSIDRRKSLLYLRVFALSQLLVVSLEF